MKKQLLLLAAVLTSGISMAQIASPSQNSTGTISSTFSRDHNPNTNNSTPATKAADCFDKITYTDDNGFGNPNADFAYIGGVVGWTSAMQTFPDYTGQVTRIDIEAQAFGGSVSVEAAVHAIDAGGSPTGTPLSSANIVVGTAVGNYGVDLPSPANVTDGFAIVIWDLATGDSIAARVNAGGDGGGTGYSHLFDGTTINNLLSDFGYDGDFLFRPTIAVSPRENNVLTSDISSACPGTPFNFSYTPGTAPLYYSHPVYNPDGFTLSLDYGDGSAPGTSMPSSHSYTSSGTMNAELVETYVGWTVNCPGDPVAHTITVDPLTNAMFSWTSTALSVQFGDLSTNATTYSWTFGDGSTSTSASPSHVYGSSGTYTIELTVTGPCGSDSFTTTISVNTVTNGGNVGLEENEQDEIHIGLFPNPSNGKFTLNVEMLNADDMLIEILSPIGKLISAQEYNSLNGSELEFDFTTYAPGTYFVKVQQGDLNITKPFVIK